MSPPVFLLQMMRKCRITAKSGLRHDISTPRERHFGTPDFGISQMISWPLPSSNSSSRCAGLSPPTTPQAEIPRVTFLLAPSRPPKPRRKRRSVDSTDLSTTYLRPRLHFPPSAASKSHPIKRAHLFLIHSTYTELEVLADGRSIPLQRRTPVVPEWVGAWDRKEAVGKAYRVHSAHPAPWGMMPECAVVGKAYGVTFVVSCTMGGQMGSAQVRASGLTLKDT
ncbi:hypothetical protein FB451DRAFT_1186898 [Mycena latifolia]|nr:hypothetical protein FB451DRAFT_1186898 [Mycena latifolia]